MLSNKSKKEILRMETSASFPYLLEIEHEDYGIFRYANVTNKDGVTFEGNVYESASFTITPPEHTQDGYTDATLSLSCIDQEWIMKVRNTNKRAKARFVASIVRIDDGNIVVEAIDDFTFELSEVSWTDAVMTWKMIFADPFDIQVPVDVANSENCPGCV